MDKIRLNPTMDDETKILITFLEIAPETRLKVFKTFKDDEILRPKQISEMNNMNLQEVNKYNASSHTVTILSSELKDGQARVVMEYANDDSYFDLNKKVLFYGTATSAKNAGYNLVGKVNAVDGSGDLKPASWNEMDTERVMIVSENIDVIAPSDIIYYGEGVTLTGNCSAAVDGSQLRYIICR